MTPARLLAASYLLASIGLVVWLWSFWTGRCNETCAPSVVLWMYATLAVLPLASLVIAVLTLRGTLGRRASVGVFAAFAVVVLLWCGFVTRSAASI